MLRTRFLARTALGLALSIGIVAGLPGGVALAKDKKKEEAGPAKLTPSKGFAALIIPYSKAFEAAKARADVIAAKQNVDAAYAAVRGSRGAARTQAEANHKAALAALGTTLAAEKAQLDAATAAVSTADDRYFAGQYTYQMGNLAMDNGLKRKGIGLMLESGKTAPKDTPNLQYAQASLAYDSGDFAAASAGFAALADAGYPDEAFGELLVDSFGKAGKPTEGLAALERAMAARKAAGQTIPGEWVRRGFVVAYNAKLGPQSLEWSRKMVDVDPSPVNWVSAIQIARDSINGGPQENLDLSRLIFRNGSINIEKRYSEREYVEYIQAADPRRLPGEVIKIAEAGIANGALRANDTFVTDAIAQAKGRIAADKAGLPALERDARGAAATAATVMAAADTFLSYGDAAKARDFYTIALTKPGVDVQRAMNRLGIAQFDLGAYADAEATFAKVTGQRSDIAKLWSVEARHKAAPAPAPAS
jgi:hypothetical protein